jgi:hypothetical protein
VLSGATTFLTGQGRINSLYIANENWPTDDHYTAKMTGQCGSPNFQSREVISRAPAQQAAI